MRQFALFILLVAFAETPLLAEVPTEPAQRALIIDKLSAIEVEPKSIDLDGPRASRQLLVTGLYPDGSKRDLTALCDLKVVTNTGTKTARPAVRVSDRGLVTVLRDGKTQIEVHANGKTVLIPVAVTNSQTQRPVSFRHELMPVLSAAGCSSIGCHGAPSGKEGFRLSLWGFDPDLDFTQLTHAEQGRRTNALKPDRSLILMKALQRIPHVGGRRFVQDSKFAKLLHDWQTQGIRHDTDASKLKTLQVTPDRRVLLAPAYWQQLAVQATFEDGTSVDVTQLTSFSTSDIAVAEVDRTGLVEFHRQGEVAILCRFLGRMESVRLSHIEQPASDYKWPNPPEQNYVDRHVFSKLKMLNIAPSELCSDEQFVRRIFLDLCGVLPTPTEAKSFVLSTQPNKRAVLIDQLLNRPEYADYWTKKWLDVLRVSRDSINLAGAKAYHGWLRKRVKDDSSLAEVVSQLLTSQGESYGSPASNFFTVAPTPQKITDPFYLQKDLAESTSQLFLGVRLQCAKCHNHPYERWSQADYLSLAAFFTQVKRTRLGKAGPSGRLDRRQISVSLDLKSAQLTDPITKQPIAPRLYGEPPLKQDAKQDRRRLLADWLTKKDNPFFAKAIVNRIWFHLNGRGIVEPVDDFRDSNPSANDPLLAALAADFVASGFRMKPLIRAITNSRSYQLSPIPNPTNRRDQQYFSHRMPRPLPAEVLLDAICHVTAVPEQFEITNDYTIGVPEGTTKFPAGTRAVQLPVTDIVTLINTSSKYIRYELHPFLRTFGQPNRTQTCECDREQNFGRKQALELIIGEMTSRRLTAESNILGQLINQKTPDAELLNALYQRALSRTPAKRTASALLAHVASSKDKRQAWEDVLWTILNSQEFIYQH